MSGQPEPLPLQATESPVSEFAGTLGAFSAANLGALRATLPPVFAVRLHTMGLGMYLSYGYLLVIVMAVSAAVGGHLTTTVLVLGMGVPMFGKVERARVVRPCHLAEARSLLNAAKRDVPSALDAQVLLHRDAARQIRVALPDVSAQWGAQRALPATNLLHLLLEGERMLAESAEPPLGQWGQEWLDALPLLAEQAQGDGIDVEATILELVAVLNDQEPTSADSMVLLRLIRTRCDAASTKYLSLPPERAGAPMASGRSATTEYLALLDLLLSCARSMDNHEALTTSEERALIHSLNDQHFM